MPAEVCGGLDEGYQAELVSEERQLSEVVQPAHTPFEAQRR
jgi:hypothetical protein